MSKTPVYKVKRFGSQYWIEKDGNHYSGPVYPHTDIKVSRYFDSPNEAWKWVEYLEEGVVDIPKPARLSPTGMTLDQAFDEPRPGGEPNTLNP